MVPPLTVTPVAQGPDGSTAANRTPNPVPSVEVRWRWPRSTVTLLAPTIRASPAQVRSARSTTLVVITCPQTSAGGGVLAPTAVALTPDPRHTSAITTTNLRRIPNLPDPGACLTVHRDP